MQAIIHTTKWPIRLNLHDDKVPFTVANFATLAKNGFYDNIPFHRVIDEFMIQGWCPLGNGTGWPGYQFGDEFHEELRHDGPGILSMANSWPWTNGSQFFITHIETSWLDGKHAVFWRVQDETDQAIVNAIRQNDRIERIEIMGDRDILQKEVGEFILQIESILEQQKNWGKSCCDNGCGCH
jgi:peptidyl-prolyl cis-trans isomerase B (cyclophilin B)